VTTSRPDSRAGKRESERGSALLVVFLFAAMVAIVLYAELPIVVMEAERQKEQTLMDHAGQYQRAIQLFFRTSHTYPPSIDALQNTNNRRFLRRRYKDPMTGNDDWRILHMGPAGVVDSLVNPLATNGAGGNAQSGFGQNASGQDGFGQQGGFGQSASATANASQLPANDPNAAVDPSQAGQTGDGAESQAVRRRRAPAVASNSQAGGTNGPQDPNAPLPNPGEPGANEPAQLGDTTALGVPNAPLQQPAGSDQNGQGNPNGSPNTNGAPNANATLANQIMRNPATSPAPSANATQQQQGSSANQNPIIGGSIAGVASKLHGRAVKVFNDQTDYAKWEFVYDFRKDTGMTSGNNPQGNIPIQNGAPGLNTSSVGQNGSSFGQNTNPNTSNQNAPPANSGTTPNPNQ